MTEPSEPLAWAVFCDEDGESDLKDHEGASVDCLVFAKEKDAQDCADDGRHDEQEPRRIVPLYPAAPAPAPDEARLRTAMEKIVQAISDHPGGGYSIGLVKGIARAALAGEKETTMTTKMTLRYEPTGEVRAPLCGEWFEKENGYPERARLDFTVLRYPILREIFEPAALASPEGPGGEEGEP